MHKIPTSITISGYFTENTCKRLVERLHGKTFYNFNVYYGWDGCKCNCVLHIDSDYRDADGHLITPDDLRNAFMWYVLNELGSL